jgi:hypothetical protein
MVRYFSVIILFKTGKSLLVYLARLSDLDKNSITFDNKSVSIVIDVATGRKRKN